MPALGHPTGNMIVVGDHVLWSYVCPLEDPGHHACVMIWSDGKAPEPIIRSDFSASDFILSHNEEQIYIMERRYNSNTQNNEVRILKTTINKPPKEVWSWFEIDLRIGEGGFFMPSNEEIIFVSYPGIYRMKRGEVPKPFFEFPEPVKRIRNIEDNHLLLLGEGKTWLNNPEGEIIREWDHLLFDTVKNAPLNRNQVFDVDYQTGELLLAYWGNRSFDIIKSHGNRETISQLKEPYAPHWVAYFGNRKLLFASRLVMDGTNPMPYLLIQSEDKTIRKLWTE